MTTQTRLNSKCYLLQKNDVLMSPVLNNLIDSFNLQNQPIPHITPEIPAFFEYNKIQTTYNNYERTGQRGRPKSKPSLSEEELAELKKEQTRKAVAKCRQKKAENKSQPNQKRGRPKTQNAVESFFKKLEANKVQTAKTRKQSNYVKFIQSFQSC